jgi:CDP-diacylglycerol--glycerol-3-phosphate 3-phosphatidyltransferase
MLDRRWRSGVERGLGPLGDRLRRVGVTADALTVFGLLCSVVAAALIASGHLVWGMIFVIVSGVSDLLDGAIARGSGQASPRGAFFDSVADRTSDAVLLVGVAWYLADQSPYLPILAFGVAACSMLVSYERARAESLGLDARGGLMERAERFVFLSVGLAFGILVPVLWIMLVLTGLTAVYRFARVYGQASDPPRLHTRRPRRVDGEREPGAAAIRQWWAARRVDGDRTRRRHPSVRRGSRP